MANISLLDILLKELVKVDFCATDKKDALNKIADLFYEKKVVKNKEDFYKNLLGRETIGSTAFNDGVAIPYAISDTNYDIASGILISKKSIDFDSLDKKPTHIFVVITGKDKRDMRDNLYLKYLAHVVGLLKNKDFRNDLLQVSATSEIFDVIAKYEKIKGGK